MIRTLGCLPALIRPPFRCSTVPLQARARNGTTTATLRVIYPATNLGPGRATQQGASIRLDGAAVGGSGSSRSGLAAATEALRTPATLDVSPGYHTITLQMPGRVMAESSLFVFDQTVTSASVSLDRATVAPAPDDLIPTLRDHEGDPIRPQFTTIVVDDYVLGFDFLPLGAGGDAPLTMSCTGLPPGMEYEQVTRTDTSGYEGPALFIFGTPTQTGSFEATYAVTDSDGDTFSIPFDFTVAADKAPHFADDLEDQMYPVGEPIPPLRIPDVQHPNAYEDNAAVGNVVHARRASSRADDRVGYHTKRRAVLHQCGGGELLRSGCVASDRRHSDGTGRVPGDVDLDR